MAKAKTVSAKSLLEKIVGWGILTVFALLPLVYYSDRAASYVTSKQYFLIGITDVLVVLWTWLLLVDNRYRLAKKNMLYLAPLAAFLLSLTISAFVGIDPANSFFSTVESGTGMILLYHVFFFACIIASYIRVQQKTFLKYILQANLFASIVLAFMTFLTGPNGIVDIHSTMLNGSSGGATMGNSLLVGAYFIFSIFLTIYLIAHESVLWKKVMYYFGVAIMALSPIYLNAAIWKGGGLSSSYFFLGEARIATVALLTGLFLAFFIWLCTRTGIKKTIGMVCVLLSIVIGIIGIQQIASPTTHVHAFFVKESGNRTVDWHASLQGVAEKPVFGWGSENFHVVYQRFFDPIVYSPGHGNEAWALHPHNNTLEVLVNGGIIGGLLYLLVLTGLFFSLWKLYKNRTIDAVGFSLLMGMFIAYIIQEQMIYESIVSYVVFFSLIAIFAGLIHTTDEKKPHVYYSTTVYTVGTLIVVILFPVWLWAAYLPSQKMDQFLAFTLMTSDVRAKGYHDLFYSAGGYALRTDAEFFADPLFYSYDANRDTLRNNEQYRQVASTEIDALVTTVDPIWQKHYYDYHLTLALIHLENLNYYLNGDPADVAKAQVYAKRAFALTSKDLQLYFAYAQTQVYAGDKQAAIATLDKALALNRQYQPAIDFKQKLQK
jgi:O-antigen ligase